MKHYARQLASAAGVSALACYLLLAVPLAVAFGPGIALLLLLALLTADLWVTARRPRWAVRLRARLARP
jgi:hypothetical protein